ncbi:MAG: hypothetical protein GX375_04345 [Clostridiales bacterium]|nr:hypothetical protein [Clostridiales bacterium]
MIKYLTHYYNAKTIPFRSLSALPEAEAIQIMEELYVDDAIWGRFKDPAWYIRARRETELWLRQEFILKGGRPEEEYPIYMIIGTCDQLEKAIPYGQLAKIQIPISYFIEEEVSFTYIDSMFSFQLGKDKSSEYYQPEYHGKVFLLSEILSIIKEKGEPVEDWWGKLPADFFPYIEAQVWNHKRLRQFLQKNDRVQV